MRCQESVYCEEIYNYGSSFGQRVSCKICFGLARLGESGRVIVGSACDNCKSTQSD